MEDEVLVVVSSGSKPENVSVIDNFIIVFENYMNSYHESKTLALFEITKYLNIMWHLFISL